MCLNAIIPSPPKMKSLATLFPFLRRKRDQKCKSAKTAWRLQILSDLHLEVGQQYASFAIPATAPYLVLAGDIGRLVDYDALLHGFLARLVPCYRRIFYVLGNHEFYGLAYEAGVEAARRLEGEACLEGKLTVLNCDKWEGKEGKGGEQGEQEQQRLTILGCTLWSDVPEGAQAIVQSKLSDFRKINGWTMAQHNKIHAQEAAWLREAVAAGREQGPLCVITHYAPSLKGTSSPQNAYNPWTPGFATELLGDGSERLNDAAIALHRVLNRSGVTFGIFGGYAVSAIGGVRESKDIDCLAAVTKGQIIQLLDGHEGFQVIPQSRQDYVAFFWSNQQDRKNAVLVEIFCEQFPGSQYTMKDVHGTQLSIKGLSLGEGVSFFLDPFHVFKGKLRAAATRSKFHDSADLRTLGDKYTAQIKARAHDLSSEYVGLAILRYPELELLFNRLDVDIQSAQRAVRGVDLGRLPPPQPGDVQKGILK
ncbi:ser thr protein phosphatase superfamily [Ophiostoma piceae UAMH 11346]|uniref:Ser thr protein phosphatase superfamily n=1 Tax=Ophiostoma piceae (strain UAMH 11346) TaxID=1262450 RepID=S3CYU6_OPHP1|nr:ser thr protein phosphatase superfamily [Ophiostoma piceae UAMH 11346]